MAKESMKARQRKREAMVARYAEKREKLKAEGNYDELQKNSSQCFSCKIEKSLQNYW